MFKNKKKFNYLNSHFPLDFLESGGFSPTQLPHISHHS